MKLKLLLIIILGIATSTFAAERYEVQIIIEKNLPRYEKYLGLMLVTKSVQLRRFFDSRKSAECFAENLNGAWYKLSDYSKKMIILGRMQLSEEEKIILLPIGIPNNIYVKQIRKIAK